MPELRVLSGGAAQGLVDALADDFRQKAGFDIRGDFGAVGGMRERLMKGERPDLVILTAAILKELASAGIVDAATITDIGRVSTAVAVRAKDPVPDVSDPAQLRKAMLTADAIYFPDPKLATAGIHFQKVLVELGIYNDVKDRLRLFPNGATAMRALSKAPEKHPIGCTQTTEIVAIDGVTLVGDLPSPHALATTYTAGVVTGSTACNAARDLIALMTESKNAELRRRKAFR
jgi:molybdate transport system substrate-binding protein